MGCFEAKKKKNPPHFQRLLCRHESIEVGKQEWADVTCVVAETLTLMIYSVPC